jgi:hypothetical protein
MLRGAASYPGGAASCPVGQHHARGGSIMPGGQHHAREGSIMPKRWKMARGEQHARGSNMLGVATCSGGAACPG